MRAHIPHVYLGSQSHPQDDHSPSCALPSSSAYPSLIPNSRITLCRKRMAQVSEIEAGKKIFISNLFQTQEISNCTVKHCLQKWATEPQILHSDFLCGHWRIAAPTPVSYWHPHVPVSLLVSLSSGSVAQGGPADPSPVPLLVQGCLLVLPQLFGVPIGPFLQGIVYLCTNIFSKSYLL